MSVDTDKLCISSALNVFLITSNINFIRNKYLLKPLIYDQLSPKLDTKNIC